MAHVQGYEETNESTVEHLCSLPSSYDVYCFHERGLGRIALLSVYPLV